MAFRRVFRRKGYLGERVEERAVHPSQKRGGGRVATSEHNAREVVSISLLGFASVVIVAFEKGCNTTIGTAGNRDRMLVSSIVHAGELQLERRSSSFDIDARELAETAP